MGRGGGGGGGHRSSGGGSHSRSFGGTSSHSSRGGSSYRSSYTNGPRVSHHHHYHYGRTYSYGGSLNTGDRFSSLLISFVICFIIFIIFLAVLGSTSSGNMTKSTLEREALKPYAAFSRDGIDDDAGWIHDRNTLIRGMESFYKETGVQPALAIYERIDGERYLSDSRIEDFMNVEYDELIGHERGLLLLFCEYADSDWYAYYMVGEDAQTVMDSEACSILMDYVHSLYTNDNYSDEEFFGAVFEKTGDRIMTVTPTVASKMPIIVTGAVVIVLAVTGVKALKQKHKRDAEKAEETERILNSPIDRL